MQASLVTRVRCLAGPIGFAAVALGMLASVRADDAGPERTPTPARTAVLVRAPTEQVRATVVDWSGYRGIRRYSPYYAPYYSPGYSVYRPYYYGNYAYRPWYARPYAYAYGYPGYAPPYYRYPTYAYSAYALYGPHAWGGFYPPPVVAAPFAAPPVVVAPQVSSTEAGTAADYVGCFYW